MIASRHKYIEKILTKLPQEISEPIEALIKNLNIDETNPPLAVFDLDWTLLDGDICESIYLHFLNSGRDLPLSWKNYTEMLNSGAYLKAYTEMIKAMAGITLDSLYDACDYLLRHPDDEFIYNIEGMSFSFKVPKVNKDMYALVTALKLAGFKVAIVSASPHYAVRYIAGNYLGIAAENAFGIKSNLIVDDNYNEYLDSYILSPITCNEGKVEILKQQFPDARIMLSCGDSINDIPMMKMTEEGGLVVIKKSPDFDWRPIFDSLPKSMNKIVI